MKHHFLLAIAALSVSSINAQNASYWQQHASYKMDVSMDVKTYRYKGTQQLVYTNNSPDTLRKVFYHLYPNAFQPGSEMDMRLRSIKDPDGRMVTKTKVNGKEIKESRIKNLKPDEIGFLKVYNFKQDGVSASVKEVETILEVTLARPLLPGAKTAFILDFDGQVPIQIRRSGRPILTCASLSVGAPLQARQVIVDCGVDVVVADPLWWPLTCMAGMITFIAKRRGLGRPEDLAGQRIAHSQVGDC